MRRHLVIGTRGSRLALIQTRGVVEALRRAFPELDLELREIVTRGDRMRSVPLSEGRAAGFFVREIEARLLGGEVDLAVHSLKDLPVVQPEGLAVVATPKRADARDVLVCRQAKGLGDLAAGAAVGTSSPRRAAQLLAVRPDLSMRPLRGNVDTRLAKLVRGDYDAIVVAKAALDRLGRSDVTGEVLDVAVCLPAPGQGALAVEVREGDLEPTCIASTVNDTATFVATRAERMLLERLGGGCHLPLGALAEVEGDGTLFLRASVTARDGSRVVRAEATGRMENPAGVVDKVSGELMRRGAAALIS